MMHAGDDVASAVTTQPLPPFLHPEHVQALATSRVMVLDTWTNEWRAVTPTWAGIGNRWDALLTDCAVAASMNLGSGPLPRTLPPPMVDPWAHVPRSRSACSFTCLDFDVADPGARAAAAPADGAMTMRLVAYGGYSERLGAAYRPQLFAGVAGCVQPDAFILSVTARPPPAPRDAAWSYDFSWHATAPVGGRVPPARQMHAAVAVRLPEAPSGKALVVFGGQNQEYLNDTWVMTVLPGSDAAAGSAGGVPISWYAADVFGVIPHPRSNHAMASLYNLAAVQPVGARAAMEVDVTGRSFVVHGGSGAAGRCYSDVHVGTVTWVAAEAAFVVRYSQPDLVGHPLAGGLPHMSAPCPRRAHSATRVPAWPRRSADGGGSGGGGSSGGAA